ncbi:MAG: polysaccharide biosynthesis protein [Syntrophomonadaceae bacterium]|nr:polysaccharide biosynthesis protein [Syntrophomonadaceae bacterium]
MNYWIRITLLLFFDSVLVNLSIYLSLLLRFDGPIPENFMQAFIRLIPWYTVITIACLYLFRLYNRMWQYASLGELYGILKAVTTSQLLVVLLIYTMPLSNLPRSVYVMSWILACGFIGGSRLGWRILRDFVINDVNSIAKRTLVVGAGDAGAMVARELVNNPFLNLQPVGFVDDSKQKQKQTLYGIPVLGNRYRIPQIVEQHDIEEIIIAIPSASGRTIREVIEICHDTPAKLRIFQGGGQLLNDSKKIRDIELEDLLRREPIRLNLDEIALYLTDKIVLITGAGGSIGSELCRQICSYRPKRIVLVENNENNLFDIDNELQASYPDIEIITEICDVKDRIRLQQSFSRYTPQVVFHAAAHKHVPMMEKNPGEAVKNNVLGSRNVAEMADRFKVEVFILISTDKAVNPSSVMGATKRIAEMIIQDYNQNSETRYAAVRFGNVLGSRGSVIPTFERQIAVGGPVTVTHPDMTRYFMTIPEAVQLVIQAGAMASGGEVFVLDMGEPVKIVDLAKDLIRLHGHEPDRDIKITYSGIRPGEKLYEELFSTREQMAATRNDRIYISHKENQPVQGIIDAVDSLFARNAFAHTSDIIDLISRILPEFRQQTNNPGTEAIETTDSSPINNTKNNTIA